jgi:flagellar biosynthesis protein FlhF
MRLKTFTAKTLSEALSRVRKDLGPEAIIVSTLEPSNKSPARVTAALDPYAQERESIESPLRESNERTGLVNARLASLFDAHGIDGDLLSPLSNAGSLETALEELFDFAPLGKGFMDWVSGSGSSLVLVGLPGAGKTVTLAKIASEILMDGRDPSKLQLVTLDREKSGALEQMKAYAKALGVKAFGVKSAEGILKLMAKSPDSLFLIDTPGINPFCEKQMAMVAECVLALKRDPFLVLPAGGDPVVMQEISQAFSVLGARRLIITCLDMIRRLGGALAPCSQGYELSAFGVGPALGDRLVPASPSQLLTLLSNLVDLEKNTDQQEDCA